MTQLEKKYHEAVEVQDAVTTRIQSVCLGAEAESHQRGWSGSHESGSGCFHAQSVILAGVEPEAKPQKALEGRAQRAVRANTSVSGDLDGDAIS